MRVTTTRLSTRSATTTRLFGTHPGPFAQLLSRAPDANLSSCDAAPLPLVLAPGMLMTGAIFDDTLARLPRSLRARALAIDHHTEASGASVGSMADALLASVPGNGAFALCGFSMGGYVAMEVLRRAPHRVARLALISSQARADSPSALRFRSRVLALAEAEGVEVVAGDLKPHVAPDNHAAIAALMAREARAVGLEGMRRQIRAVMDRPDSRSDLAAFGALRRPTLVACGDRDRLIPRPAHEELAELLLPSSRIGASCGAAGGGADDCETLMLLPDCGHLVPAERPAELALLLERWMTMRDRHADVVEEQQATLEVDEHHAQQQRQLWAFQRRSALAAAP